MDIEEFVSLVERQYQWLSDLSELDGHYLDVPQERWRRPTKADYRRACEWLDEDASVLPSVFPEGYRPPPTRVQTALSIFPLRHRVVDASQRALAECQKHAELTALAPIILRLTTDHLEWLAWLKTGQTEKSAPEADLLITYQEILLVLRAHQLLCCDHKKAEWDRWLSLCSTAKRRDLLTQFWLLKRPMKRSEIAPGSGTEFRGAIKELNEIAATAKPVIPWMIRSDSQQKWAKHWFGKQG